MRNFNLRYERLKLIKSPAIGLSLSAIEPIQTPPFTALFSRAVSVVFIWIRVILVF